MEALFSLIGLVGAACAVGMYAAVSLGKVSAERPIFFGVNAIGAVLVLIAASREFDVGDLGTIGQELIWAILSVIGVVRASTKRAPPAAFHPVQNAPARAPRAAFGLKNVTHRAA